MNVKNATPAWPFFCRIPRLAPCRLFVVSIREHVVNAAFAGERPESRANGTSVARISGRRRAPQGFIESIRLA